MKRVEASTGSDAHNSHLRGGTLWARTGPPAAFANVLSAGTPSSPASSSRLVELPVELAEVVAGVVALAGAEVVGAELVVAAGLVVGGAVVGAAVEELGVGVVVRVALDVVGARLVVAVGRVVLRVG
eukprot:3192396-Rhodomonas_salina.1